MATAYVSFGKMATTDGDQQGPVVRGNPDSTEAVTTSGTSAATTNVSAGNGVAVIFSDTAHYATVGATPTATATTGWYIPANQQFDIKVSTGDKVALITA